MFGFYEARILQRVFAVLTKSYSRGSTVLLCFVWLFKNELIEEIKTSISPGCRSHISRWTIHTCTLLSAAFVSESSAIQLYISTVLQCTISNKFYAILHSFKSHWPRNPFGISAQFCTMYWQGPHHWRSACALHRRIAQIHGQFGLHSSTGWTTVQALLCCPCAEITCSPFHDLKMWFQHHILLNAPDVVLRDAKSTCER